MHDDAAAQPRVLVIDDSPAVVALVRVHLEAAGCRVAASGNGVDGLAAALHAPPDLILLDVNMPGLDGYEVCRRLRQAESTRAVPLVMLTGLSGLPAKLRAFEIGADDFVSKPFDGVELLAHVRSRLRTKRVIDDLTASQALLSQQAEEAYAATEQLEARLIELADELQITRASVGKVESEGGALAPAHQRLADFREGIARGEMLLHYQPKVRISDGELLGVEALVRWEHPTRGLLLPARFIPFAEHSAVADDLAGWVVNAALGQASVWREGGQCIGVAVNLSARNLHNPGLPKLITAQLEAWQLPAKLLTVELTETAVMRDERRAVDALASLRDEGVSIAIDDFGTGQSSLHYLDRLPIDELKIDGSLVAHLDEDERRQVIVSATTHMAHRLGLRVVAEGVETEQELHALAEIGCEAAQGYYLSRPLPADALLSWHLGRFMDDARSGASTRPGPSARALATRRGHGDRT